MKTLLRILKQSKSIYRFITPYFFFTILAVVFGTINITLLGPLLEVLFSNTTETEQIINKPEFDFSFTYFIHTFKYYSTHFASEYGIMGSLYFICSCMILCGLIANVGRYLQTYTIEKFNVINLQHIRQIIYEHVLQLDYKTFSKIGKSDIMTHINLDTHNLQLALSNFMLAIFRDLFQLLVFLFTLFYFSYELTLVSLLLLPFSAVFVSKMIKFLKKKVHQIMQTQSHIFGIIDETFDGFKVLKAFNAEKRFNAVFEKENLHFTQTNLKKYRRETLISPVSEFFGILSVVIIVLYGGHLVINRAELPPEDFIVFIALFSQLLRPAKAMSTGLSGVFTATASGERIFKLLDTKPDIKNSTRATKVNDFKHHLVFDRVSFGYDKHTPVLKDISFTINKGETIGIVGLSGGGKTTLLNLIPRFFDVVQGKILLDGTDIKDIDLHSYRKLISVVTQETYLFHDSIRNNISLGHSAISDTDVQHAAKMANAHDFILGFKDGYETLLETKGTNLSGGQKQRISIARAMAKDPKILLFDEATSSLDGESEKKIQHAIQKLAGKYTCIIIAHRLSTIKHANKILVLDNGKIKEQGTHEELIQKDGIYKSLYLLHQIHEKDS